MKEFESADLIPADVKAQLQSQPELIERYVGQLGQLINTDGWKLLIKVVDALEKELIKVIRQDEQASMSEVRNKLIAVDIIRNLPFDLTKAMRMLNGGSASEGDGFSFVDEKNSPTKLT